MRSYNLSELWSSGGDESDELVLQLFLVEAAVAAVALTEVTVLSSLCGNGKVDERREQKCHLYALPLSHSISAWPVKATTATVQGPRRYMRQRMDKAAPSLNEERHPVGYVIQTRHTPRIPQS